MNQSPLRLARKVYFSSAHFYKNPEWSDEENKKAFGDCFSEHGHGHNYILEAEFEGSIDPSTGLVVNLVDIDKILKEVVKPMDHKHLNLDHEAFKSKNPTTENIANFLFDEIENSLKSLPVSLTRVRLYEEDDLYVDVYKDD